MKKLSRLCCSILLPIVWAFSVQAQQKVVVVPMVDEIQTFVGLGITGSTVCTKPGAGDHWVEENSCSNLTAALQGQDANFQKGLSINPRFTDNGDGTVLDSLTGLIWLKNAHCAQTTANWPTALAFVLELNTSGEMNTNDCGDVSKNGQHQTDWRLPNIKELQSLLDFGDHGSPYLSDKSGAGHFPSDPPFLNLQTDAAYWSSTTYGVGTSQIVDDDFYDNAQRVNFDDAVSDGSAKGVGTVTGLGEHVWAVRGG